tara:strand:+ start:320 stop:1213 length:894 start_codon:yes stop_codon:yes gene_type:complete
MSHDHSHHAGDGRNILVAFFLNATFSIIEFIGGYITNSVAIYSDAVHDFGDSLALLFSYFAEKLSQKEADEKYTFGYRRFSMLSAFINGLILLIGSSYVIIEAISRIKSPEVVKPEGMLGLAIVGIAVNTVAAYRMSKNKGLNSKMVMYHLFEDLFGWIAVFVVSIVLLFKPWYILDSILSIFISLIILRGVYKNLIKVGMIFLQKFPDKLDIDKIQAKLLQFDLIKDIHGIKGWSIDDETYYLSLHVTVPEGTDISQIDELNIKIKSLLAIHDIKYSTVEFESSSCNQIQLVLQKS